MVGSGALPAFAEDATQPDKNSDATRDVVGDKQADGADSAPFNWDWLVARMKARADAPYQDDQGTLPDMVAALDYDKHRRIRFKPDHARWRDSNRNFELQAFYPGWLFDKPVHLFEVVDGKLHPMAFQADDFEYREPLDAEAFEKVDLPGVAGFRLHYPLNHSDYRDELVSFLGSSYFRVLGRGNVYGLSARGLAVDTAAGTAEEFPRFTRFYIQRPEQGARDIRLFAELESERVVGVYAFTITPGVETVVDVQAAIFLRDAVSRLGLAPLSSMYLFGENDHTGFDDFRPEVHDSDGLVILRASGERVWRPLTNPGELQLSVFSEDNPGGFGLLQRDRSPDHYLDTEACYERRPSVWIEPVGAWGKGSVFLAEIPSKEEVHDNVVAFWMPEDGLEAGSEHWLHYRMLWAMEVEGDVPVARVIRTRTGRGGTGSSDEDPDFRKFLVDFAGEPFAGLGEDAAMEVKLHADNGKIKHQILNKLPGKDVWRLIVDIRRKDTDKPIELNAALFLDEKRLTETWTYQWGQAV
ncbi:glucan biosynthesis protein G [Breoghania sp.]|uniref:glucan biosynthesis protein n=1 Tax=Breoghania sp. TaxID=2065378 RepID=UPI00263510F2|nr:glucan biosynthesis protein G [Breoghania sp.]